MFSSDNLKLLLGASIFISFFLVAALQNVYSGLVFVGLIALASAWGVFGSLNSILIAIKSRNWPQVKFKFLSGKVNVQTPPPGKGFHTKYMPKFEVEYDYEGKSYICSNEDLKRLSKGVFYTLEEANEFLNELNKGGVGYICPDDPLTLFLRVGVSRAQIFVFFVSLLMMFISIICVYMLAKSMLLF